MSETPGFTATAYTAEWQLRTARMLARLVEHGAAAGLPAVTWRVTADAPQLMIAPDPLLRSPETDFRAWKAALTELAGPASAAAERLDDATGEMFAYAVWDDWERVRVNLGARWEHEDLSADDGDGL